jgi:predicted DsbA family dithiol-disulfide isomerase
MNNADMITIDVVSDVVCPWCYIGQKRLESALAEVADVEVDLRWRPYQLDPTIPPEGIDRKQYMLAKFGTEERLRQIHANLEVAGDDAGIEFDFDAIKVSPNTLDAHRLIRWAATSGSGIQGDVARRLFSLYFEQGVNIGDPGVLVDVAGESGMDAAVVATLLATDADREAVEAEIATANRMGIRGVPCFLIEGRYAVMGAQDSGTLAEAIRQVAAAKARGELEPVS